MPRFIAADHSTEIGHGPRDIPERIILYKRLHVKLASEVDLVSGLKANVTLTQELTGCQRNNKSAMPIPLAAPTSTSNGVCPINSRKRVWALGRPLNNSVSI